MIEYPSKENINSNYSEDQIITERKNSKVNLESIWSTLRKIDSSNLSNNESSCFQSGVLLERNQSFQSALFDPIKNNVDVNSTEKIVRSARESIGATSYRKSELPNQLPSAPSLGVTTSKNIKNEKPKISMFYLSNEENLSHVRFSDESKCHCCILT